MKKSLLKIIISLLTITPFLLSCGVKDEKNVIRVVATPVPHAVILEQAIPLLEQEGYQLKIQVVNDYITPNLSLTTNSADANFFQHLPYLHQYNQEHNTNIISVAEIHIEPIGLYSKRIINNFSLLEQLSDGDVIIMSNSPSDQGRLLFLLQEAGLITLASGVDTQSASLDDIVNYAKNFTIRNDIAPEFLVSMYRNDEAALVLINSNFALDAGLNPLKDAIILEKAENNPYTNILAILPENEDDPKIQALIKVLNSIEISNFIIENYKGVVLPVGY